MIIVPRCLAVATVAISLAFFTKLEPVQSFPPAKQVVAQSSTAKLPQFTRPPLPKRGAPGNAGRGAGSRSCLMLAKPSSQPMLNNLNALVPEEQVDKVTHVWGLTTLEHPTLWFYIPYDNAGIDSIGFTLQDEDGQLVQKVSVPVPQTTGLIRVKLSDAKPGLQVGRAYNWFFTVRGKCFGNPVVFVEGWIARTSLDAAIHDRLQQASPSQQAALFAEKGIWYDALNLLATLRQSDPQDTTAIANWTALLKESGMEPLATQAIGH
ncbi:protein of unknown function DUF928 [Leptolyngbyaceae cyanobacterium JSC-12]|nr:protein of unknown function DUF928 [Leptolyngbyaceae cyanobacterium JSC-12]